MESRAPHLSGSRVGWPCFVLLWATGRTFTAPYTWRQLSSHRWCSGVNSFVIVDLAGSYQLLSSLVSTSPII